VDGRPVKHMGLLTFIFSYFNAIADGNEQSPVFQLKAID
jgi:hypothetical protein